MDIKPLVSAIAFIALAGVLLAAAIALNDAQTSSTQHVDDPSAAATGALHAELARCKPIRPEMANAPICKAGREHNRRRFFEPRKLREDKPADLIPATPDLKSATSTDWGRAPNDAPQSPAASDANPSPASGDRSGARAE